MNVYTSKGKWVSNVWSIEKCGIYSNECWMLSVQSIGKNGTYIKRACRWVLEGTELKYEMRVSGGKKLYNGIIYME